MDPTRLPGRQPTAPVPAPLPTPAPAPAPTPQPQPQRPVQGEPFTGLDPLTRSLIEEAPTVPVTAAPSLSTPTAPPTQAQPPERRRGLKQPAFLVALGGSLAAGLLVLTGAVKHRRSGYPAPAGPGARVATGTPTPILPAATPAPAATWLIAGGSA